MREEEDRWMIEFIEGKVAQVAANLIIF